MAEQDTQVTAAYSGSDEVYEPSEAFRSDAHVGSLEEYEEMWQRSVDEPEAFWRECADRIDWFEPFETVKNVSFEPRNVSIKWYEEGVLNACHNAVDRHLDDRADQTALIYEPNDPATEEAEHITYADLHENVCRFANILKKHGVEKGDRVTIYLPMIPEAAYAMLACARIGAPHSVVFAGFSPDSLADRILDCESTFLITADEGVRAEKKVPLKDNADAALEQCPDVDTVLVVQRTGGDIDWTEGRDVWYHDERASVDAECPCEPMSAEDPLFILYTSGSTGKPKGVMHTTGGYCVYTSLTHEYVFDYHEGDVFWCTADVGWITGHSYIVYGPLINGATQVFFEGTPTYPDAARLWEVVDKHDVNIFYTAPTAIRALMRQGDGFVERTDRSSLRVLGTVGEPINPEAWRWYYNKVGNGNCPIVDTWWQTETGGVMITPLPGAVAQKPGAASKPFFGIKPEVVDTAGTVQEGACEGILTIADSWPGQMRTVYRNHDRFQNTYFSQYPGKYFTGDGCRRDDDGYYWITGRVDDVLNVSGHRIGTAELESALVAHDQVAEAAVVGFPHEVKGQGIYAYVTLLKDVDPSEELRDELVQYVREHIGPIAKPDFIQFTPSLPKTRSGKIMRRIIRKIAAGEFDDLGDTSTLADPGVVEELIDERRGMSNGA
ncbi:acetate--CoA ligase [Longibacter sp.]|jgi:acetyl-CoA synthetase|uniref:acetate--CoA ligase n=1 Tax=Longibacter sp. TaxID=2045415 RepID=UPI003EBED4EA